MPEAEPKFNEGDRVWVKTGTGKKFDGWAGTVTEPYRQGLGKWDYRVRLDNRADVRGLGFMEAELEAIEGGEPRFRKGDRVKIQGRLGTIVWITWVEGSGWKYAIRVGEDTPSCNESELEAVKEGE